MQIALYFRPAIIFTSTVCNYDFGNAQMVQSGDEIIK